jgi:hypothetical protein
MMRVAGVVDRLIGLQWAFTLRTREPETEFDLALTQLHDEAVRLIRDGSPGGYARIAGVYEQLLLAQPETWARYGQRFGPTIASGLHPFQFTLMDRVERRLYEELELAVMSPSREIGREALNLPIAVAFRAVEPRAISHAGRMLRLYAAVQSALIRAPSSDNESALFGNSWLRLAEYGRSVEHLVRDDSSLSEAREYGAQALRQVFETYALMAKAFMDQRPRATDSFREINDYLNDFLKHWTPEYDHPREWVVANLAAREDVDPRELDRARSRLADKEARVDLKRDLDTWRALNRFALLAWSLRKLRPADDVAVVDPWNAFVGYFGSVDSVARVADRALELEMGQGAPWTNWGIEDMPRGASYRGGMELGFLQAFLIVALNRTDPGGPVPELQPLDQLASRSDELRTMLTTVVTDETLRQLLPAEDLEKRVAILTDAIDRMVRARAERDDQRLIETPIDPEAVEDFRGAVRKGWDSARVMGLALARAGMYEEVEEEPPDGTKWGFGPQWTPRGLFVSENRVYGRESIAAEMGAGLAATEIQHYAELARDAPEVVAESGESLAEALRRAVAEVRDYGSQLVVVVPDVGWELLQSLELTLSEPRGGDALPPVWMRDVAGRPFLGSADDAPVLESYEFATDKLVVIALDRFARWRQWRNEDGHAIQVAITDYDETSARALAQEHEDLFRAADRTTIESRAREMRKSVVLDVFERFAIEIVDPLAARSLVLPDDPPG